MLLVRGGQQRFTYLKNPSFTFNCFLVSLFVGSSRELNQAGDLFNLNHRLRGSTTPQVYRTHLIFLSATAAI